MPFDPTSASAVASPQGQMPGSLASILPQTQQEDQSAVVNTILPMTGAKRNEAFLNTLPEGVGAYVKAMSDGRAPLPSGMMMRTPLGQMLLTSLGKYDPTFDIANQASRTAMRKAATSGILGQNIASYNTVMGHLKELNDAITGLNNGPIQPWNWVENTVEGAVKPSVGADVNRFNTAADAVATELTKAFRGSTGAEEDVKNWRQRFNASYAPEVNRAAIQEALKLMKSRIEATTDQYNRGMGTSASPQEFLRPQNAQIFNQLVGQGNGFAAPAPAQGGGWSIRPKQ